MNSPASRFSGRTKNAKGGFLLLETMIGVMIFALGMLALAHCVEQCINAEAAGVRDERARLALQNRMAEIEAGAFNFDKPKEEKLEGMFNGITLLHTKTPLAWEDAQKKKLNGLFQIQLEARWEEAGCPQSKTVTFYVLQGR